MQRTKAFKPPFGRSADAGLQPDLAHNCELHADDKSIGLVKLGLLSRKTIIMIAQILAEEILAECSQNRQSAKINSPPKFPAIRYIVFVLTFCCMASCPTSGDIIICQYVYIIR